MLHWLETHTRVTLQTGVITRGTADRLCSLKLNNSRRTVPVAYIVQHSHMEDVVQKTAPILVLPVCVCNIWLVCLWPNQSCTFDAMFVNWFHDITSESFVKYSIVPARFKIQYPKVQ